MAIIKCEKCGADISDKAIICPSCGILRNQESSGNETYSLFCKECGKAITNNDKICPHCGCLLNGVSLNPSFSYTALSIGERIKGLGKKAKGLIIVGVLIIVIAVILIIVFANTLTGDDKVAYNLILESVDNFKNPSSVRLVSGEVGVNKDCLFCGISATNGFGARSTSYYYISSEGWMINKDEDATFLYKSTKHLNINKINNKLEQKLGNY